MAKRLNSPAVAKEYVRHKAWRAKGRLERLIEALPFDEEPEEFRNLLAEASAEPYTTASLGLSHPMISACDSPSRDQSAVTSIANASTGLVPSTSPAALRNASIR